MDLILSVVVLCAFALAAGAVVLFRRGGTARQAWLMLLLAGIMLANALIWALPAP